MRPHPFLLSLGFPFPCRLQATLRTTTLNSLSLLLVPACLSDRRSATSIVIVDPLIVAVFVVVVVVVDFVVVVVVVVVVVAVSMYS